MKTFGGTPYIDVETSIKSFIPKKITENTKRKLIKFYMEKLDNQPELLDKIEFDIVVIDHNSKKEDLEQIKK